MRSPKILGNADLTDTRRRQRGIGFRAGFWAPWCDRDGGLSLLRCLGLLGLALPALWMGIEWVLGRLGPMPAQSLNLETGLWAIRFLCIGFAITPFRQISGWAHLVKLRRMIGIGCFLYAAAHLVFYASDQAYRWQTIFEEISTRVYLMIGLAGLVILLMLAATSTDAAMRRLGGRAWRRLHQLVYAAVILAVLHFLLQAKLIIFEPLWLAGFFVWLLAFRLLALWRRGFAISGVGVATLTILAAGFTAGLEIYYYAVVRHLPAEKLWMAQISLTPGIRPAWLVLMAGGAIAAIAASRSIWPCAIRRNRHRQSSARAARFPRH